MSNIDQQVFGFVQGKITYLCKIGNESAVRATLAQLRRGIGHVPGDIPELWGITLDGMPAEMMSTNGSPTKAEWASYTALTLFALHQQGKSVRDSCMYADGVSLGKAARRLIKSDDDEERIRRRFNAAATAESMPELSNHLRGLVQLLKSESIPLDYPRVAKELYYWQIPDLAQTVRLRWGQDFYSREKQQDNNEVRKDD